MGFGSSRSAAASIPADWNVVSPGFFATLGVTLVQGRDFAESDTAGGPPVAIVNQAFARAAWPGLDPVGRQFESDAFDGAVTVIGVADDARFMSVAAPAEPYVYAPLSQLYRGRINLLMKTGGQDAIADARALIRTMNPNLPVTEAMPLSEITALNTVPHRIAGAVAATLGAVGLLLAAIGLYGVTSYAVGRRTREIGIRVALGADASQVLRMMLRQGAVLALTGIGIGLALAAVAAQLIGSLLAGIGVDPLTFAAAALLFLAVALLATYLPARRALAIDPMAALRQDA